MEKEYIQCGVFNVYVFDENGKLITKLDSLIDSYLKIDESFHQGKGELFIKNALLNVDFLKFVQGQSDKDITDFERISKQYDSESITFNFNDTKKKCKIIAEAELFTNNKDINECILVSKCIYEIPNAVIHKDFSIKGSNVEPSVIDSYISFSPYNEKGDLFKLHIKNN